MKEKILSLIKTLNEAAYLYYNTGNSFLSDKEYDAMLSNLAAMEESTGLIYSNSPTQKVGAQVLDNIKKINLGTPMLSLAKVHSQEEVDSFVKGKKVLRMIKADGLSVRLCYEDGKLSWASTRGDGTIGNDITQHIQYFTNVPMSIGKTGQYIIDGEAIIKDQDFITINKNQEYANSRNLAAGTLNLLDMSEVASRKLSFIAWDVINGDESNSLAEQLNNAQDLGFEIIHYSFTDTNEEVLHKAEIQGIPCDGVVWKFDDKEYGKSLGRTAHHFNSGIAWKPEDEKAQSKLIDIEWSLGRTGVLTPVAIFEPVWLEGSEVERASLHNPIVLETLLGVPYVGQEVEIVKSNQIIPQIVSAIKKDWLVNPEAVTEISAPTICPVCGAPIKRESGLDSEFLVCKNNDCAGKLLNRVDHYCGKKGLDIKGLSKATIEKLIDWGWINEISDLYYLAEHKSEWVQKPGFGEKSVINILSAIEYSRIVSLEDFLSAIGIPLIGSAIAKDICKYVESYEDFRGKVISKWNFSSIDGIAAEKEHSILSFDYSEADKAAAEIRDWVKEEGATPADSLNGLTIVITGKLHQFPNRDALVNLIAASGGKVAGSISKSTSMLINNDIESNSSKNRAAKELGIPILTEEKFLAEYLLL